MEDGFIWTAHSKLEWNKDLKSVGSRCRHRVWEQDAFDGDIPGKERERRQVGRPTSCMGWESSKAEASPALEGTLLLRDRDQGGRWPAPHTSTNPHHQMWAVSGKAHTWV